MTISFTLLTDTPARLRDQLIARGIIETYIDSRTGQTMLKGARPGVEWVEVPNPIVVTPAVGASRLPDGSPNPARVPAVMDPRHVYLVKVAWGAEGDETSGLQQDDVDPDTGGRTLRSVLARTKLGQWVMGNSVPDTITSADGRSWQARNINNNFWLIPETQDFGAWQ